MTADDEADDATLGPLRAVWLSMREEEPPDRGLAALMAAARVKADDMAAREAAPPAESPGWWQRLLAMLRRAPVLALATGGVLVGGALVVSQREDALVVESEVAPLSADGTARGAAASRMEEAALVVASDAALAAPTTASGVPSPIERLIARCAAAAAREDCAAVRELAARIATADPEVHRTRIVRNPTIARCLP